MEEELETSTATTSAAAASTTNLHETSMYGDEDIDSSACSTPYVSAPSSPGRGPPISGYYFSAPSSPVHFILSSTSFSSISPQIDPLSPSTPSSFEFDFSAPLSTDGSSSPGPMSSADELFLNGQIRPVKLSSHLRRPQILSPLLDVDENDPEIELGEFSELGPSRGRDFKLRNKSLRRRTRSMSPLRGGSFDWQEDFGSDAVAVQTEAKQNGGNDEVDDDDEIGEEMKSSETTPCDSGTSSRSSSVGRSSKRWVFLKEFLYRSKSEGRNNGHKFWGGLSFSPKLEKMEKLEMLKIPKRKKSNNGNVKEKGSTTTTAAGSITSEQEKKKAINGVIGKRRGQPSAHELHYTANRAQAEEMRRKTFLPYRQGLLGCLGFSSKSYGAWNGFTRALNPVSSR